MNNYQDARTEEYEEITVFGHPMIFSNLRIDRETVPKGMFLYEMRHGDDWGVPCEICERVVVNHFGTLISNRPLDLSREDGFLLLDEEDWSFEGTLCTLQDYMENHPPKRERTHER